MTNTAGKLFGTIGQGGHQFGFAMPRAPQCSMDSRRFGQSMLARKQKMQEHCPQ